VDHYVAKLREPEFRQAVSQSRESVDQLKNFWRQRERQEVEVREKLVRQQRPSDEARSHYAGSRGGRRAPPRGGRQGLPPPPPQQSAQQPQDFENEDLPETVFDHDEPVNASAPGVSDE
jgi:hypothetical protein